MKNRFIKFASAIALSAMLLTACASAPRGAMVKIGEKYITKDQVQKEYDRVIASYSDEQKAKYDESTEEGKKASLTLKQNILDMFSNIEVVKQKFAKLEKEYKDEGKSEEEIAKVSVTEQEINDNLAKVKEQLGDKFNEELEKAKLTEDIRLRTIYILQNFKLGLVKIMIQLMKKLWKNTKVVTLTVHKLMQAIY